MVAVGISPASAASRKQQQKSRAIHLRGGWYSPEEAYAVAVREQGLGNFRGAADIYDRILARVPDHAGTHNNRGVALQEMKRHEDALVCFNMAIALEPDYAEAHNNRGLSLQALKRYDAALAGYGRAIASRPDYAKAWLNRGNVLHAMKRQEDALASYDKAIALKPGYAEAYNNRGVILQELKRYDDALASYGRATALHPGYADAWQNRGLALLSKGDMQEAERTFLKAHALKPDFPDPLFSLAGIRKYSDADHADIKRIEMLLARPGASPRNRDYLYFALGKMYDDCGRYDDAFESYRQANRICNEAVSYNSGRVARNTGRIMNVFSRDFLAQEFSVASPSRAPVFIVGMPRSGTTLLASILSNHHAIATAGELPTIIDFTLRLPELTHTGIPYPQAAKQLTPAIRARLIQDYERRLRRDVGLSVPHVIDKHPLNFMHLGFISMLFPKARIIHCTRHPFDTALSSYFQRFSLDYDYAFDLRNIAHFYGEYARIMEHWKRALPVEMIEVGYEDMITNTRQVAGRVLGILGLKWDERCLAPHTNACAVETASSWQVRQPIYRQSIGRWRHYEKHLAALP